MFRKVLVANRGEIACRIIRTCRKMGIRTVVIYSAADINARHVRMADEAYFVPKTPSGQVGYLNERAILKIAKDAGVEAIHPGYGFFSENAAFARRCQEEGIVFIGPSAEVLELVGDKVRALEIAKKCGVPTALQSAPIKEGAGDRDILAVVDNFLESKELSSVVVKPTVGGGGIGIEVMHLGQDPSRGRLVLVVKRRSALASRAFGNGDMYLEEYVPCAFHVEVQILVDTHGTIVHLFTRDCSIQRRNQKVVEEGPSRKISPEGERKLYAYALRLARMVGYTGAGTVEFLVTRDGKIYFLEMNARLQVEHSVTEMITGLDLVALQIQIAAGEPLPFNQGDIRTHGHAIEVRISPEILRGREFVPQLGSVVRYQPPQVSSEVRLESALYEGYEVLPDYEPLMAKLICWGRDREDALARLAGALESFTIMGVQTNINFLRSIVEDATFRSGEYDLGFLADQTILATLELAVATLDFKDLEKRLWQHVECLV